MSNSVNKHIESLNNPEYKFLISLKKNRNRKSENKSIAEGYRENSNLIDSSLNVDTLYICPELFVGENNEKLPSKPQEDENQAAENSPGSFVIDATFMAHLCIVTE